MPSALSHDPSISTPGASTDNAIVIFDGTGGTGFGNSTILVDSGGNGRIGIAADTDIITVTAETVTIAGKVVATSLDIGDGDTTIEVTQSNHSLTVGMPVRVSGANQYAAARATTAALAEVVGIVTAVASSSAFTLTLAGEITTAAAVPDSTSPGDIVYLSTTLGAVTTTEPSAAGEISKPLAVITEANNKMIMLPFRGEVISSATDSMDLNGTELVLDVDADTSITADTDDQIDIRLSGADDFQFTANSFTALAGSTITSPSFITGNSGTLKLMDSDGSNFFTLAANATTTADVNYTWPAAGPASNGYALTATTAGVLSWAEAGGAALTGSTNNTVVTVTGANAMAGEANLVFDGNNLAIGQSSPVAPLQVHKETAVSDPYATFAITSRDNLSGANGNFGMAWQQVNASNVVQVTRGHLFFNNQTNNMQLETHSTGKFLLKDVHFYIEHITNGTVMNIKCTNASGTGANGMIRWQDQNDAQVGYIGYGSSNGTFQIHSEQPAAMTFGTSGYGRLTIAANGTFSGSATNDISDQRIKENIENTTVGLAEVLQLRPVKYNFMAGKGWGEPGQKYYGFLAQEVEAIIPEAVMTADIDIDDEQGGQKRDPNGIRDLKSVTMTQITTALVKAVQELNAKVTALGG